MSSEDSGESRDDSSRPSAQTPQQPTVLLAEDDEGLRESYRIWLANDGRFDVREAADGEEALEKLAETVDVLVLDRKMPKLSGPEVLERLPEQTFGGTVIVVSAFESDSGLSDKQVTEYVTKPIDRAGFLDVLERHI